MSGGSKGKSDEATRTLVGARPIKMLETGKKKRDAAAESPPPAEPTPIPLKAKEPETAGFEPEVPRSVEETGLDRTFLEALCLKHLVSAGELRGARVRARQRWLPLTVLVVAMFGLRLAYYGEWLPNTYHAKYVEAWPQSGWRYAASFILEYALWLPLGLAVWVLLARRPRLGLPGLVVLALVTVVLSNFMSNTATVALLLPVAVAILPGHEVEVCLVLGLSASCALLLPVSTPPNAIVHATGEVQTKDFRPGGLLIGILGPIIAIAWVTIVGQFVI